jgi:hypothetical protein
MKGAEAYVNDQWQQCGLASLPQGQEPLDITLHFDIPRDTQFTGLFQHICEVAERHLREAYPGRDVHHEPVVGSVLGDGSGDAIRLHYRIGPAPD